MKKLVKLLSLVLVASMLLVCLASCDASGSIKKAYEKAEYTVNVVSGADDAATVAFMALDLSEDAREELEEYEIIVCTKNVINIAAIVKFPSSGALKDFLTVEKDGKKDYSLYEKAKEEGKINGNCYLIGATTDKAAEPFAK